MRIWLKRVLCSNLDPRPFFVWKRVWGKALPGSVLSVWILSSVLMKERMPLQPTSIWVLPMQWQEASIHRNFENWSWQIALMICLWNLKTVTFHQYTSKQGYYLQDESSVVSHLFWGDYRVCPTIRAIDILISPTMIGLVEEIVGHSIGRWIMVL